MSSPTYKAKCRQWQKNQASCQMISPIACRRRCLLWDSRQNKAQLLHQILPPSLLPRTIAIAHGQNYIAPTANEQVTTPTFVSDKEESVGDWGSAMGSSGSAPAHKWVQEEKLGCKSGTTALSLGNLDLVIVTVQQDCAIYLHHTVAQKTVPMFGHFGKTDLG
jgi:hypothetical protein